MPASATWSTTAELTVTPTGGIDRVTLAVSGGAALYTYLVWSVVATAGPKLLRSSYGSMGWTREVVNTAATEPGSPRQFAAFGLSQPIAGGSISFDYDTSSWSGGPFSVCVAAAWVASVDPWEVIARHTGGPLSYDTYALGVSLHGGYRAVASNPAAAGWTRDAHTVGATAATDVGSLVLPIGSLGLDTAWDYVDTSLPDPGDYASWWFAAVSPVAWSTTTAITGDASISIPPLNVGPHAVLLWATASHDAALNVTSYSRFTDPGGAHYAGTTLDEVTIAPGLAIVGMAGVWYIPDFGDVLQGGGTVEVHWNGAGAGVIGVSVVDLGGPTTVDTIAGHFNSVNSQYPGYRVPFMHGYGQEVAVAAYAGIFGSYVFGDSDYAQQTGLQANSATTQIWATVADPPGRNVSTDFPTPTDTNFSPSTGSDWWYNAQGGVRLRLSPVRGPDAWDSCFKRYLFSGHSGATFGDRSASLPLVGTGIVGINTDELDYASHPGGLPHNGHATECSFVVRSWPAWSGSNVTARLRFEADAAPDEGGGGSVEVICDGSTYRVAEITQWGASRSRGSHAFDPTERYLWFGWNPSLNKMRFGAGTDAAGGLNWWIEWFTTVDLGGDTLSSELSAWMGRARLVLELEALTSGDHGAWVLIQYRGGCPVGARAWAAVIG